MCLLHRCCYCCSLRAGAKTAAVLSFMYCFSILVLGFLCLFHATAVEDKREIRSLVIGGLFFLLFGCMLASGTISLAFGIIWNLAGLVVVWLVLAMIVIIFSILPLFGGPKQGRELYITLGVFLLTIAWHAFLLYLWIVVLNFYRDLNKGGDGRIEED